MPDFHFTVTFEGKIEAPDPASAREWAMEEVMYGQHRPVIVEAVPATRKDAPHGSDRHGSDN